LRLRTVVLLLAASLLADAQQQTGTPESKRYEAARLTLRQGDIARASRLARDGYAGTKNPAWRELFSILEADALCRLNPEGALSTLAHIPATQNPEARVRRLMTRGYALYNLSRVEEAERAYASADELAKRIAPKLRPEIAVNRIGPWFRRHRWDIAERYVEEAIKGGTEFNQPFVVVDGKVMRATIEMNREQWELAQQHFSEVAPSAAKIGSHFTESAILGNVGWCYRQLGDLDEARNRFAEAEAYAEAHQIVRVQPVWLANLANVYVTRREFQTALPFAQRAVAVSKDFGDNDMIAMSLDNLAQVLIELRRFDEARRANEEALAKHGKNGDVSLTLINLARLEHAAGDSTAALATLNKVAKTPDQDARVKWQAQAIAASIYADLHRTNEARRMYEEALKTGDTARNQIYDTESYLFAFETNLIRFYDDYIELLLTNHDTTEALRVAERSRARTLREGLGWLERGAVAARSFSPKALARAHNATILCYWFGPTRSLVWVVTPDSVDAIRLQPKKVIEDQIEIYRREILDRSADLTSVKGRRLYELLLAPAAPRLRSSRVIVIPDGRLSSMNLEAAVVPSPKPHFWLEDVTVTYAPALQFLQPAKGGRNAAPQQLLLVGDIPSEGSNFPVLPRARTEIDTIAHHFAPSQRVILAGMAATPRAYLATVPERFELIHFAAHGTANERVPLESSVILATGRLSGEEIKNAKLRAELVTVSSCNSAGKRSYAGEGLVGLAWAFLRAGAERVIAAQWDVSDAASPALMDVMYAEVAAGRDPATALRDAKLKMLRSGGKDARPFNWAPFILYGAP
jgi:CHAT domain-containing protein